MLLDKKKCGILFDKNMRTAKGKINEWFKRGGIKFKKLDLIFSKIDFNHNENVFISNNERCYCGFYYSLYGEKISGYEDILLLNPGRICVRSYGKEELYEYVEDSLEQDGFRMRKIKSRSQTLFDGVSCISEIVLQQDLISSFITIYNNEFSVNLSMSYSYNDNLSEIDSTQINNNSELEKYLTSLTFPYSILDTYKKICEISLGDYCLCHSLFLSFSRKIGEDKKIQTDKLVLKNGKLCELKITTSDGKIINMDQLGNFSYTLADESISFSMKELGNDKISYSVSSNADKMIDDYMDGLMTYDIGVARRELNDAKKRVREVFSKSKR